MPVHIRPRDRRELEQERDSATDPRTRAVFTALARSWLVAAQRDDLYVTCLTGSGLPAVVRAYTPEGTTKASKREWEAMTSCMKSGACFAGEPGFVSPDVDFLDLDQAHRAVCPRCKDEHLELECRAAQDNGGILVYRAVLCPHKGRVDVLTLERTTTLYANRGEMERQRKPFDEGCGGSRHEESSVL